MVTYFFQSFHFYIGIDIYMDICRKTTIFIQFCRTSMLERCTKKPKDKFGYRCLGSVYECSCMLSPHYYLFDMLVVGLLEQLKRMRILPVSKACTVLTTFSFVRTGEGETAGYNSNSNSAKTRY